MQRKGNKILPWTILSISILAIVIGIIINSIQKDESPPRPGPSPRIPKVNLIIQSNVGGAEVYLDNQQKAIVSDTHHRAMLFNLVPKTYQIMLKKQGYIEWAETVEITGQTISQTIEIYLQPK